MVESVGADSTDVAASPDMTVRPGHGRGGDVPILDPRQPGLARRGVERAYVALQRVTWTWTSKSWAWNSSATMRSHAPPVLRDGNHGGRADREGRRP